MSWLSKAIDKGRKKAGLPVISVHNAGAIIRKGGRAVAPFVPGGTYIEQGVERFAEVNHGKSGAEVARETWGNVTSTAQAAVEGAGTAARVEASVDSAIHSPTTVFVLVGIVVWLAFGRGKAA